MSNLDTEAADLSRRIATEDRMWRFDRWTKRKYGLNATEYHAAVDDIVAGVPGSAARLIGRAAERRR